MRLVTWNCCRGLYLKNAALLHVLEPDVAVLQECAQPMAQSDQCLWFGDNPRQGIAVLAKGPYRIRALATVADVPRYAIPIEVTGPINFILIAIWSKADQEKPYVEAVIRAVELYRNLFTEYPTVLAGDLNSNAIWDAEHAAGQSHSALVEMLFQLGLVSCYHYFNREKHGEEKQATYYFQWKEERPFHLDYCFIPAKWAPHLRCVEVGSYVDWKGSSDHRPILVELFEDGCETRKV